MALPSSGVMKASMIQTELGESGSWSINSQSSRALAKVPSGTIKFSDFYGKSNFSIADKRSIGPSRQNIGSGAGVTFEHQFEIGDAKHVSIVFRYDLALEHNWNKSGSKSTWGAEWTGNPANPNKYEFYRRESYQIRNSVLPADIPLNSMEDVIGNMSFVLNIDLSSLTDSSLWNHYFQDDRDVQRTNMDYYASLSGTTLTIREAFTYRNSWHRTTIRLNRAYWMYLILNNPVGINSTKLYYNLVKYFSIIKGGDLDEYLP